MNPTSVSRKELYKIGLVIIVLVWQSSVVFAGTAIYVALKPFKNLLKIIGTISLLMALCYFYLATPAQITIWSFITEALNKNILFWELLFKDFNLAFLYLLKYCAFYIISLSPVIASLLLLIDYLMVSPHAEVLADLRKGKIRGIKELSTKMLKRKLERFKETTNEGTLLGISKSKGTSIVLPDYYVNQMVLVLGTTGAGKTVTLRRFCTHSISQETPLIIVDGKPTTENINYIKEKTEQQNKKFYGFNCISFNHYDFLSQGGYTELKDKIMCLKDQWENDYYKAVAEDYLQSTLEVLKCQGSFGLNDIVECLTYDHLTVKTMQVNDDALIEKVKRLKNYEQSDLTGLQAHLSGLINSELGVYFTPHQDAFTLLKAIEENAVVYFALPTLKFPSFSKVHGKLVINDIKTVISNYDIYKKIFCVFDEFCICRRTSH